MTPLAFARLTAVHGVDLNVRAGRLYAVGALPPDLAATIREHRGAIIAALETLATCPAFLPAYEAQCRQVAIPDPLRMEAETLAAALATTGGLGHFIVNLFHTWNDLTPEDRAASCHAWRLANTPERMEHAA